MNGGSASTSEAVAAALRESGGAVLIGEPSFGKAKMQRAVKLTGGATLLLSNTVFLSPKHAMIDKVGQIRDLNLAKPACLKAVLKLQCVFILHVRCLPAFLQTFCS